MLQISLKIYWVDWRKKILIGNISKTSEICREKIWDTLICFQLEDSLWELETLWASSVIFLANLINILHQLFIMIGVRGEFLKLNLKKIQINTIFQFNFRSVHMRLYSMNKREFVLVILAFFACFGLGIFIGLAGAWIYSFFLWISLLMCTLGPPITLTKAVDANSLQKNDTKNDFYLATGPFVLKSPFTTTYSQQLWLFGKIETESADSKWRESEENKI